MANLIRVPANILIQRFHLRTKMKSIRRCDSHRPFIMSIRNLPRSVSIVYRRLPKDIREIPGILRKVTPTSLEIESPIATAIPRRISGRVIADSGFLAIWFIYRHKWYDVGKFYDRARNWIGYYCDIVQPIGNLLKTPTRTTTITDLFLDLWITPKGRCIVLDEDELENALKRKYITRTLAERARKQISSLVDMVQAGRFPSQSVRKVEPLRNIH